MITNLITHLANFDKDALLFLNSLHAEALDPVMLFLTNKWLWIPMSILIAFFVVKKGGMRRGLFFILCIGLAVAISDQVCSSILRPAVERMRPSNLNNPISSAVHVVNNYRGGRYGFPSAHASTSISIVIMLALYFKRRLVTLGLVLWALMLCYTRIYLGVHYPGDIVVGGTIGTLSGVCCHKLYMIVSSIRKWPLPNIPFLRPTTWP